MRLLVIEDDVQLAASLTRGLREHEYAVDTTHDGEQGALLASTGMYDVILLDILLPGQSGLEVLRQLRGSGVKSPVLCITALGEAEQKVAALDLGADDYVVKPFDFGEVLARVRALMRRSGDMTATRLACGDLELDPIKQGARRAGVSIDLSRQQYRLLEFLLRHAGRVVTRTAIIEGVWDMSFDSLTNVVEVCITRLRAKVDRPFGKPLIHTVRGVGYMLSEEPP
jgi:two-component system OmpR family response regulator